ncbi:MAG TPA: SLBB domain-containing protein [Candidatus Kapabacteria bacterium]|nr:SLBB domain-containing protein [Candidatus Kapabacteria bacterium]
MQTLRCLYFISGAVSALLVLWTSISHAQSTGIDKQYQNRTAIMDTATERMLAQRQAIRAGTDAQALEGPIDPSTYILGPGDGVYLNVYAAHFLDQDLTVTPEGKLILPQTGQVLIGGMSIPDAEKKVNQLLTREYKNPDAHLSLRRLRAVKVSVLGEVLAPGVQTATSLMRVSEVIAKAGDMTAHSSLRNIEVRRADGTLRAKADLVKYFNTGDIAANPMIEGGDVIVVPRVTRLMMINGAVSKPGSYEYAPGDKLSTLIALAQGALPSAQFDSIEIARYSDSDPVVAHRFYVNYSAGNDEPLQEGDAVMIRGLGQYHTPRVVTVEGEIAYPGKYSIEVGQTHLRDILQRAGGILPSGSLEEAVVLRRSGVGSYETDPEFIMLQGMRGSEDKRMTDDQYNYLMARSRQLGRTVMVVNFKDLITKGDESQDIILRDQDSIWVPRARGYVSVIGNVNSPGNINYVDGASYDEYIDRAGGYTSSADKGAVRVINSKTSTYINPRSDSHYQIGPGDTIVIPPDRPTFWQNFQIITAVTAQVITIIAGVVLLKK